VSKQLKLALAVILLVVALAAMVWQIRSHLRDDSVTWAEMYFKCEHCGHTFMLPKEEYERRLAAGETGRSPDQRPMVECPECGEMAVSALKCPKCGTVYIPRSGQGGGQCPKCGWSKIKELREKYGTSKD